MGQEFKINDCGEIIRVEQVATKKTNWWVIVSLFLFFVLCILSYALYELYEELLSKEQEINTLQEELSLISEDGFGIHSIEFGNNDCYGNTLTEYGNPLYSSKMRYLMPRLIYYATGTKNITFQYKIFNPDGTLHLDTEGYLGDGNNVTLYAGKKNIVELVGWGNEDESTYDPGTYSIEMWYNGKCVKKQSFEILQ